MKRILIITFILFFSIGGVLFARTKTSSPETRAVNYDQIIWIPNKIAASILNDGRIFHDPVNKLNPKNDAGLLWPYPVKNAYIFGSGLWVGCVQGTDTLVSVGYNPNSGASEFVPGLSSMVGVSDPDNRIYDYPDDWPAPESKFPMAPQENFSPNDIWFCFNDLDSTMHDSGDTRPMGIEVYVTGYAWTQTSNQDMVFLVYTIKNVTDDTLKDMYMSVTVDPDIGDFSDDMIGLILDRTYEIDGDTFHVDNLGVCYDYDGKEKSGGTYQWEEGDPGCIAFDFLQSPYALSDGIDNDGDGLVDAEEVDSMKLKELYPPYGDRDGDGVPDWEDPSEIEQLGMRAFKKFIIDFDPDKDWKRYMLMAGYDLSGVYNPYDSIDLSPGDKRFLQATGPFVLLPESTVTVVAAVIASPLPGEGGFNDRNQDTLAMRSSTAQFIFNMNWLLPAPPPSPNVTIIPGDNMVILTWDDSSENTPDPYYKLASDPNATAYDPTYIEYDFQGYRVWRSMDGKEWKLLGSFDKADGIVFEDTVTGLSARDVGLVHSFVDDDSVVNGYTYYYAVTAFDYNYNQGEGFSLESGKKAVPVVPRRGPANVNTPIDEIEFSSPHIVSPDSLFSPLVVSSRLMFPDSLDGDTLHIKFKGYISKGHDSPGYIFDIFDGAGNLLLTDTLVHDFSKDTAKFEVVAQIPSKGIEITIMDTMSINSITNPYTDIATNGTYPVENISTIFLSRDPKCRWAYRGTPIKIKWMHEAQGWTIQVEDLMFGDEIPYETFARDENGITQGTGAGWCFYDDLLAKNEPGYKYLKEGTTKGIFVQGAYILLGKDMPEGLQDGEEWTLTGIDMYAPVHTEITLPLPLYTVTDTAQELHVKVVPNPYIVTNTWEKDQEHRQIAFYDLPDECTIRIYNIAGDLVKVIEHTRENGGTEFWNLLNENGQIIASGVYLFSVDSKVGKYVGKIFIVH